MNRWLQRALAYGILISIVIGSFLSPKEVSTVPLPGTDKLHHGTAYFLLTLAFLWPYRNTPPLSWWKIILLITIMGGAIEPLQPLISPGRACDLYDFFADCAGIILAVIVLLIRKHYYRPTNLDSQQSEPL